MGGVTKILLIFGLYQFSYGLFGFLFWPLYDFSYILVSGNLDGILVKPINELLQLYGKGIGDVGGVFIGLVIIIRFINKYNKTSIDYNSNDIYEYINICVFIYNSSKSFILV